MKLTPFTRNSAPMLVVVFFLSVIIVFGVMEHRFLKKILFNYEDGIQQVALNKTTLFLNDLKAVSESAAKKIESGDNDLRQSLKVISTYDYRISNVYLADSSGAVRETLYNRGTFLDAPPLVMRALQQGSGERVAISGVHNDPFSHFRIVSGVVKTRGAILVIDFRIDQYQKEIMQEFINENYKIAVFDSYDYPVYWPFDKERLDSFKKGQSRFYDQREHYNVVVGSAGQTPWQLYFYFKENNFETFRTITILFLVFALYCCLYQLLVELLGVNSAKTYFENIDFAILNQINEGIILTNNAGRVVFANNAAHGIFSGRKSSLMDIQLKEILGNIEEGPEGEEKPRTLTVKMSDKFLETIHSPIVKKGKKLGSLSVIRLNVKEERTFRMALGRLMDIIPEGAVFIDKNHEVAAANLMARCYLGNLDQGSSIDMVDPALADFIYENIGSGLVKRMEVNDGLVYEIAPVYDDDGVYAGTLVLLLVDNAAGKDPA